MEFTASAMGPNPNPNPSNAAIFRTETTLLEELKIFQLTRESDPASARAMYELGCVLEQLAGQGSFRKFVVTLNNSVASGIKLLSFFVVKALKASLINGHLMIASYILDNGYPINNYNFPSVFHEAIDDPKVADYVAVQVLEMLQQRSYDLNTQQAKTYLTFLHIAIRREFFETTKYLLSRGADVNAVASGDSMPLMIAEALPLSSITRSDTIQLLKDKGAKSTWKRPNPLGGAGGKVSFSGGGGTFGPSVSSSSSSGGGSKSTMVSFKGFAGGDSGLSSSSSSSGGAASGGGSGKVSFSSGHNMTSNGSDTAAAVGDLSKNLSNVVWVSAPGQDQDQDQDQQMRGGFDGIAYSSDGVVSSGTSEDGGRMFSCS